MSTSKNRILVVAAHPDDEVLGCGGTMAMHARNGDEVRIVLVAEGITSREGVKATQSTELEALKKSARASCQTLGAKQIELLGFADQSLDTQSLLDVVKPLETFIHDYRPTTVYTHHGGDLNLDHQMVHRAVITACRPLPQSVLNTILFFEVPSSTEWNAPSAANNFSPNWYVDISETLATKKEALKHYASEMRPWPHPRSYEAVEHLARWRGATISRPAAEAFMLGRKIVV